MKLDYKFFEQETKSYAILRSHFNIRLVISSSAETKLRLSILDYSLTVEN